MDIKITDNLYLRSDQYCCWLVRVSVVRKGKTAGTVRETILGYYHDPAQALQDLLRREIGESEATILKELLDAVNEHKRFIEDFVRNTKLVQKEGRSK